VPDQRIIYVYDMHIDQTRISVSLATVEFRPAGAGTQLIFTEQATLLDGYDNPVEREEGTRVGLDRLDAELRREAHRSKSEVIVTGALEMNERIRHEHGRKT